MSADSWSTCPKCSRDGLAHIRNRALIAGKEARDSYGKVSPDEYAQLSAKNARLEKEIDNFDAGETLREDYHFFMSRMGKFSSFYQGSCQCGFSFRFEHEEEALLLDEPTP